MDSAKFSVVRRSFTLRNGGVAAYDIVKHPGAAVVLPVFDDGRVIMIRNRRIAVDEDLWELPAGTLDNNEDPLVCAQRELTEETGYTASSFTPLTSFFSTPGICTEEMFVFVARGLTAGAANLEHSEEIETHEFTWDEAMTKAGAGQIRDAKSLLCLLFFERFGAQAGAR